MKTLEPHKEMKIRDLPRVELCEDGVYIVTIILAVILFSVMVGVYL